MAPRKSIKHARGGVFALGVRGTNGAPDLQRVGLPTGSPTAIAQQAQRDGLTGAVGGRPESDTLLVYPWWERPPLGSLNYLAKGASTQSLAATINTEVVVAQKTCPAGYYWCVRGINIFVDSPLPTFNVDFILRAGGSAVGDAYSTFGRNANSLEVPFSILEQGSGEMLLQLVAVNRAATGPWTVNGSFTGWFTPARTADMTGGLGR